ncbi:MAG: septum site-determining protein MinC [Chloroflexota bacterium]|jgi:septum site-determining protein MinC
MNDTTLVQIKGIRDGLLVSLGDAGWPVVQAALLERIQQQPAFFQGARLALDVGNLALKSVELSSLRDKLSEHGIMLWAILSLSPVTENTAQILGLATRVTRPRSPETPLTPRNDEETAMWVNKTIRSGTRIEYAGHVVVFGDVNPGAEVIAGGSVIVWGRLRGVVHAGAKGNRTATVCALDMSPTQLRIAGQIAVSPTRRGKPQPEIVRIKDNQLQAETWTPG